MSKPPRRRAYALQSLRRIGVTAARLAVLGATVALSPIATPAAAQDQYDRREWSAPGQVSAYDIRLLDHFVRCVADRQPERVRAVLAMDYRSRRFQREIWRVAQNHWACGSFVEMRVGGLLLAGGLAEALLHRTVQTRDLPRLVALDPARPPIVAHDQNEVAAICTVRAAPDSVAAALATEAGSHEEAIALGALVPRLSACVGVGRTLTVNRASMRALIALAAYRLSEHDGGQQPAQRAAALR